MRRHRPRSVLITLVAVLTPLAAPLPPAAAYPTSAEARSAAVVSGGYAAVVPGGHAAVVADRAGAAAPDITAAASVPAGELLAVTVTGVPAGTPVTLVVVGSMGSARFDGVAGTSGAPFVLPTELTRAAGRLTLVATPGAAEAGAVTASVDVEPGGATEPVEPVVGARSIVADGTDRAMAVAVPVDRFGNAIADGSEVVFTARTPQGATIDRVAVMGHLLSWTELVSGTVAGSGQVWVRAGQATGPEVTLQEVPGVPEPFTLEMADAVSAGTLTADGRALVRLRTSILRDRFGNVTADGTEVVAQWDGAAGRSLAAAETINGVATWTIQSPAQPGAYTITARSRGTATAAPLSLEFRSVLSSVPFTSAVAEQGLAVTVGPVSRDGGSFVPDGTVASVVVSDGGTLTSTGSAALVDGRATVVLPTAGLSGRLTVAVSVLGTTSTAELP